MQELSRGAEAIIYKDKEFIIKDRIEKSYRLKELDEELRFSRTKREAKFLKKIEKYNFSPKVYEVKNSILTIEFIEGSQLKELLNKSNYKYFAKKIGKIITLLHEMDIIHGDLTTSNMIVKKRSNNKVYFIDFGLSFVSARIEDKAVDLHLLKQALESKHFDVFEEMFDLILENYNPKNKKDILERFNKVELRGRNKAK